MKRVCVLLFFVLLLTVFNLSALDVTIGNGGQQARKPFDFYYHNSIFQTLYYPNEIETTGLIDSIRYYYTQQNTNLTGQRVQIWMGTTAQADLSSGWIHSTQLTLVFDGLMDFSMGQNTLTIPLSTPYLYSGQNLVIMTKRPWEGIWISDSPNFQCQTIGTDRARNFYSDAINPDPANPPTTGIGYSISGQFPKTNLHFSDEILPPYNVQSVHSLQDNGFNITWNAPYTGTGELIHYDNGTHYMGFGSIPASDFDVAIRFTPSDLTDYAGLSLFSVKFIPLYANETHTILVWTGGSQGNAGNVVRQEPVINPVLDVWNTIDLSSPVLITGNEELWIGVRYEGMAIQPASGDIGPLHNWRGNLICSNQVWHSLYDLDSNWLYNWNIQGMLNVDTFGRNRALIPLQTEKLSLSHEALNWSPGFTGKIISSESQPKDNNRTLLGYKIWRFKAEHQDNQSLWTLLTPNPIDGYSYFDMFTPPEIGTWLYRWAVRAVYTNNVESVPAFSNIAQGGAPNGMICGIVTNSISGLPLNGVRVYTNPNFTQTFTDANGYYELNKTPGNYILYASLSNYHLYQNPGVEVTNNITATVNIGLVPLVSNPEEPDVVAATELQECYPNPFKSATSVRFAVKNPGPVTIEIYNLLGQKIHTIVHDTKQTGFYSADWNGTDKYKKQVANGVYFVRMTTGDYSATEKVILLK